MGLTRIETERLWLRPLSVADAEAVFAWAGDPLSTQYMAWPRHRSLEDTRAVLEGFVRLAQSRVPNFDRPMGIVRKDDGTLIGSTGLHQDGPHSVRSGWILSAHHRGKKYASEACLALFATAFAELPWLQTVHVAAHPDNHSSIALAVKLGFRTWGTVRADFPQLGLRHFEVPLYRLNRP